MLLFERANQWAFSRRLLTCGVGKLADIGPVCDLCWSAVDIRPVCDLCWSEQSEVMHAHVLSVADLRTRFVPDSVFTDGRLESKWKGIERP